MEIRNLDWCFCRSAIGKNYHESNGYSGWRIEVGDVLFKIYHITDCSSLIGFESTLTAAKSRCQKLHNQYIESQIKES